MREPSAARDRPDELDRHGGAERQPVDREIEGEVHQRQRDAERRDQPKPRRGPARLPRPPPGDEHGGRRHDAQPGDARGGDRGEEQHGERGADVLRDRAEDEQRLRREPVGDAAAGAGRGMPSRLMAAT